MPTLTPPPNGLRLYVANAGTAANNPTDVIPLPLNNASHPVAAFSAGRNVAFDASQRLWIAGGDSVFFGGPIAVFAQPIENGASPSFDVAFGTDVKFDGAGDMFVSSNRFHAGNFHGFVSKFVPPITSSSGSIFTIDAGDGNVISNLAIDGSDTLYATQRTGGLLVFAPPVTANSVPSEIPGISIPTFDKAGNMYAISSSGIGFYKPPFSAAMTPVFTIKNSPAHVYALALDPSGNLYVAAGGTVVMFAPPIGSSNAPAVTITTSAYGGLAIGP